MDTPTLTCADAFDNAKHVTHRKINIFAIVFIVDLI